MSTAQYDSRTADKFVARLPDGLRGQIEEAALRFDRSMNSIIIQAVKQYLDGQRRQELLLDALSVLVDAGQASRFGLEGENTNKESFPDTAFNIDEHIKLAVGSLSEPKAEPIDPRDLFISANPAGASPDELQTERSGFVDERTHGDYLIFLSGYRAAQEAEPCAD